jgi:hypothetical protein
MLRSNSNAMLLRLRPKLNHASFLLTPKVPRGQILAFAVFGHVAVIRCDMIFWEFYTR